MNITFEKHSLYPEAILIRKFIGKVSVNDIIESWKYLYKHQLINVNTKGLINNLQGCELIMDLESFTLLLNYMKSMTYIKNIKIAVIADNPKTIIFPILGHEQERELNIKPFSTMDAAVNWVLLDMSV